MIFKNHGNPPGDPDRSLELEKFKKPKKLSHEGGLVSLAGGWKGSEELVRILDESERYGWRDTEIIK